MQTTYPYFPLNISPYNCYQILTINMCIKNFPIACNMTRNFYCLGKGYCLLGVCFLWSPYQVEQLLLAGTAVEHKLFKVTKEFLYLFRTNLLILPDKLTQISSTFIPDLHLWGIHFKPHWHNHPERFLRYSSVCLNRWRPMPSAHFLIHHSQSSCYLSFQTI